MPNASTPWSRAGICSFRDEGRTTRPQDRREGTAAEVPPWPGDSEREGARSVDRSACDQTGTSMTVTAAWLRSRYAAYRASKNESSRAQLRRYVRRRCIDAGVTCPEWAAARRKTLSADLGPSSARRPAREKPTPAGRDQTPPSVAPVTIPPELRAWRQAGEGRALRVSRRGVELHSLDGVRRFPDVATALAAI